MKRIIGALALGLALVLGLGAPALAGGSDSPTPYTVGLDGITLPKPLEAHDHINVRANQGPSNIHLDPNNNQPGGKWIGKTYVPWGAFGYDTETLCVTWVQIAGYNQHFGEGGQQSVGKGCGSTPPEKPADPEPRVKHTLVCKAAQWVTDTYQQSYALVGGEWVLGKEVWVGKTTRPATAAECGYDTQWRQKVTVDCKGGVKNLVITDFYKREWSFDSKTKTWVLGKEAWSHKTKTPATEEQCPITTPEPTPTPTPEPSESPKPTPKPTPEPTPEPTVEPSPEPSPTTEPTPGPTVEPSPGPSATPTPNPEPTTSPTPATPSATPTAAQPSPVSSPQPSATPTTASRSQVSLAATGMDRPTMIWLGGAAVVFVVIGLVFYLSGRKPKQ